MARNNKKATGKARKPRAARKAKRKMKTATVRRKRSAPKAMTASGYVWVPARRKRKTTADKEAARERRRLREETAPGRGVTKEDRRRVFDFYGRRCLKCGRAGKRVRLVLDHVVPLYLGGEHDTRNMQVLCRKCNLIKGLDIYDVRPCPFIY